MDLARMKRYPGTNVTVAPDVRSSGPRIRLSNSNTQHTASRSRRLTRASFALNFPPSPMRGRRECRAPDAPAAACAEVVVESTRISQVTPESPGIPRAMVLTASFALSPATGLSCHRRLRTCIRKLDTSVGVSGPHDFSVRFSAVRQERIRVHRIPPRVRDDREPPLCGTGQGESIKLFLPSEEAKNFSRED
jgi:hypothetical protein